MSSILEKINELGYFAMPLKVFLVIVSLFLVSVFFYLISILEYNLNKQKMKQILIIKLNAKLDEISKQHNVKKEQIVICYDLDKGFFYQIYNNSGELEKEQVFSI